MNTSVACTTFTTLSNYHLCLVPEHFYRPNRRPILLSSYSPAPGNHQSASCLSGFICLVWTFHVKWGHTLGSLSCLASFTQHDASGVHPHCGVNQGFIPKTQRKCVQCSRLSSAPQGLPHDHHPDENKRTPSVPHSGSWGYLFPTWYPDKGRLGGVLGELGAGEVPGEWWSLFQGVTGRKQRGW